MTEQETATTVTCLPKKSKLSFQEATATYIQTWRYTDCGLILEMEGPHRNSVKTVAAISIMNPNNFITLKGVRIGSPRTKVIEAYGNYCDKNQTENTTESFVVGSVYDGLMFTFVDNKVTQIYLGAAAE